MLVHGENERETNREQAFLKVDFVCKDMRLFLAICQA